MTHAAKRSETAEERRCIVSGDIGSKEGLIRFVVDPQGQVVPDLSARLPGRGLWVGAKRELVEKARAKGLFSRAARQSVVVAETLGEDVEGLLARRAAETLGLARRAGELVMGFEKVMSLIDGGDIAVMIEARDGARDGSRKLEGRLRAAQAAGISVDVPIFRPLWAEEMGLALGHPHVIHAALTRGRMQAKVLANFARLETYGRTERDAPTNARAGVGAGQ